MKLKDAINSLQQAHPEDDLIPLWTPWGETLDKEHIWQEYPRPQFKREDYHILNGAWDYTITPVDSTDPETIAPIVPGKPFTPLGEILVPFSPESLLSGVNRQLQPEEYLWYQRRIIFSQKESAWKQILKKRCLLHFGAVDQQAVVYINGQEVAKHVGGYLPFTADITDYVSDTPCLIQVRVRDESDTAYYTRGKQTLKRGGMFYTAQSGIWQTVWYEWVPENYIGDYRITPDYDHGKVEVYLYSQKPFAHVKAIITACNKEDEVHPGNCPPAEISVEALAGSPADAFSCKPSGSSPVAFSCKPSSRPADAPVGTPTATMSGGSQRFCTRLVFAFPNGQFHAWSPEEPYLYSFRVIADEDEIESYFAMRCYTVERGEDNIPRFCLNHQPYFLHGILDQGYWSDGLMTAPCDEAFVYDISLAQRHGFNMLRKHIKIEPLRWYYHCDRLGMVVWQDMVSGGTTYHMPLVCYMPTLFPHMSMHTRDHHYRLFSRASLEGRLSWEQECLDTMEHLYNVPSLGAWVPFNEGWGQFDAARIALMVKEKDPTRPVDHASGWFDQKGGDFRSVHNYFRPLQVKHDGRRAFAISEYGGYACHIPGHASVGRIYGYKKFDNASEMSAAFKDMVSTQLMPLVEKGLSAAVYTQLSDVEEEVNGLVTYDRRIEKLS